MQEAYLGARSTSVHGSQMPCWWCQADDPQTVGLGEFLVEAGAGDWESVGFLMMGVLTSLR